MRFNACKYFRFGDAILFENGECFHDCGNAVFRKPCQLNHSHLIDYVFAKTHCSRHWVFANPFFRETSNKIILAWPPAT